MRQSLPEQQNTIPFQRPTPKFQQFMSMYSVNHVFDSSGKKQSIDDLIHKGENKTQRRISLSNEIGRLTKGVQNRVSYTDTMELMKKLEIPKIKNYVRKFCPQLSSSKIYASQSVVTNLTMLTMLVLLQWTYWNLICYFRVLFQMQN